MPETLADPVDQMEGMNTNSPVPTDGGSEQFDISPDNDHIAFTGKERDQREALSTGWKISITQISSSQANKVSFLTDPKNEARRQ